MWKCVARWPIVCIFRKDTSSINIQVNLMPADKSIYHLIPWNDNEIYLENYWQDNSPTRILVDLSRYRTTFLKKHGYYDDKTCIFKLRAASICKVPFSLQFPLTMMKLDDKLADCHNHELPFSQHGKGYKSFCSTPWKVSMEMSKSPLRYTSSLPDATYTYQLAWFNKRWMNIRWAWLKTFVKNSHLSRIHSYMSCDCWLETCAQNPYWPTGLESFNELQFSEEISIQYLRCC